MSPRAIWIRRGCLGLLWALSLTGILVFRAHQAGQAAMVRSDAAFHRGDVAQSLSAAREAAGWYFPFAPHVELAQLRMLAIARGAESTGDEVLALRAYSAISGVLLETTHPGASDGGLLKDAQAGAARLLPGAETARREADLGGQRERPAAAFYAATSAGMALWLLALLTLPENRRVATLTLGIACGGAGLFLWVFAALGA